MDREQGITEAEELSPAAPGAIEPAVSERPVPQERARLVKKHPLAIRWFHWVNFPVLMLMIWSGVLILWAYDRYPDPRFALDIPNRISFYQWGITPVYSPYAKPDYPVPAAERYDIMLGYRLAEGMAWHFTLAWLFTLNGVAYLLYLYFSGQWRYILPRRDSLREAFKVVLHDLRLYRGALPPGKYNHAQRIAYTGVLALGAVMVATGLAIYKPAQLNWLADLFGGYQSARTFHFLITILFVLFFLVHVAQVIHAGWNNFRGMITGYEVSRAPLTEEHTP